MTLLLFALVLIVGSAGLLGIILIVTFEAREWLARGRRDMARGQGSTIEVREGATDVTAAEFYCSQDDGTCYWCDGECEPTGPDTIECVACAARGMVVIEEGEEEDRLISRWPRKASA